MHKDRNRIIISAEVTVSDYGNYTDRVVAEIRSRIETVSKLIAGDTRVEGLNIDVKQEPRPVAEVEANSETDISAAAGDADGQQASEPVAGADAAGEEVERSAEVESAAPAKRSVKKAINRPVMKKRKK
jgi:hypothetical protein